MSAKCSGLCSNLQTEKAHHFTSVEIDRDKLQKEVLHHITEEQFEMSEYVDSYFLLYSAMFSSVISSHSKWD